MVVAFLYFVLKPIGFRLKIELRELTPVLVYTRIMNMNCELMEQETYFMVFWGYLRSFFIDHIEGEHGIFILSPLVYH